MSTATFAFTVTNLTSPAYFRVWWPGNWENVLPGWMNELTFGLTAIGGLVCDTTATPGTPITVGYINADAGGYVYIVPTSPGSGAIASPHINWLCTATINNASPAGVGKCSVTWAITCRDAGGATLSTLSYEQPVPNGPLSAGIEMSAFPGGSALAALDIYAGATAVSLTTTLPNRKAATMGTPASGKDRVAILFPGEGNICTEPENGTQYVSRRVPNDIATPPDTDWWDGTTQRYMRRSPGDAWAIVGSSAQNPPESEWALARMGHVAYHGATQSEADTAFSSLTTVFGDYEPQPQSPGVNICRTGSHQGSPDDTVGHVWLDWHSADELWTKFDGAAVLVDANIRTASDTGCLPHPWIYRGADGTWIIGALCGGGNYKEWRADEVDGAAWSLTDTQTLGAWADLDGAQWAQGRDGRQVVIGGSGVYLLLHRAGDGETWAQGTQTWDYSGLCSTPYVYERPDGTWEAGWLDITDGTWHMWTALDPAGTWTEL